MPPAVEVEDLAKRYGDSVALAGVTLAVEEGECVALLGPNGAGKSTLIEILATLARPTSGTIRVRGADVRQAPGQVREAIGVAFQQPIASKHLTAREVLVDHARLYGVPKPAATARAGKLLDFVGLADRADDRVGTFSGGMERRLDLARVLTTDPDVLVLDEPTAGLDPRARADVQDRIRDLVREGTTVLLATHDLHEAERLAHRVAVLDQGQLLAADRPDRLAREIGARVVRVDLPDGADPHEVRRAVTRAWGIGKVIETGTGIEVVLDAEDPGAASPGEIVDALEDADIAYEQVTVREPDLGDVFLELTGRSLDAEEPKTGEVPA